MTLLLILAAGIALLLILAFIPKLQVRALPHKVAADRAKELENEFRKTIAQIIGGSLILIGSYLTWQGILASRQKEVADRFTAAIGHLENDSQTVRIEGIYTLGRIMRDSPSEGGSVVAILSAFVRDKSPWQHGLPIAADLRLDIQAAVSVIGERPQEVNDQLIKAYSVDFSKTDLRSGQFADFRFARARMLQTHLDAADLEGADLRSAELQGSVLDRANLRNAKLQGADLTGASIEQTNFAGANLSGIKGWTEEDIRKSHAHVDSKTIFR
jgi:pentapeptide repeat protein